MKTKRKPASVEPEDPRGTKNDHAYELFVRAQQLQSQLSSEAYLLALELYAEACAIDPRFVRAQLALANLCCAYYREYSKNPKWLRKAEACLSEVYQVTGVTVRTLYIRGLIEWISGNMLVAEKLLLQAAEMDPTYSSTFNILGNLYYVQGKTESAVAPFRRSLELEGGPLQYCNLLSVLDALSRTEELAALATEALPVYQAYLKEHPSDMDATVTVALIRLWSGDREGALRGAEDLFAHEFLPGRVWYNLGCLFDKLGKPELYLTCLRTGIDQGFRDINEPFKYQFAIKHPELSEQLDDILSRMRDLIKREQSLPE